MRKLFVMAVALLVILSLGNAEETKYTNASIARLSCLTGQAYIQRASDIGSEECVLNAPVTEGDRVETTDGRAEINFGRGNFIRLDENTKIDFLNLPKEGSDAVRIRVWSGNVFLDVGNLDKEKNIEIHTADTSFYVLDEGLYRVGIKDNKETEILVFRGMVEADGEEESLLIKAGQRLDAAEGRFSSRPSPFVAAATDDFDRWNDTRNVEVSRKPVKRYLPSEMEDFEYELGEYGDWTNLPPYGYVWVPRGMDAGWRPYSSGRWQWLPLTGWTWVPCEPWGWAAFHYGRWHWGVDIGWYWIPTSIWGPAWVNWWWDNDYFAWAPTSWWGYPIVIVDGAFYGRHYGDHYPHHSRALTVIHRDQLRAKNISQVALRGDSLKTITRMNLSNPRLGLRPTERKTYTLPIEGKRILIRNDNGPTRLREDGQSGERVIKPETLSPRRDNEGRSRETAPSPQIEKRNIRKKNESAAMGFDGLRQGSIINQPSEDSPEGRISRRNIYGYPSSPTINGRVISRETDSGERRSIRDIYRYFSGESYSSRRAPSSSDSPSRIRSGERNSPSPARVSSGSRGSSFGSSSSHGGSQSSSRPSGSIRKKD